MSDSFCCHLFFHLLFKSIMPAANASHSRFIYSEQRFCRGQPRMCAWYCLTRVWRISCLVSQYTANIIYRLKIDCWNFEHRLLNLIWRKHKYPFDCTRACKLFKIYFLHIHTYHTHTNLYIIHTVYAKNIYYTCIQYMQNNPCALLDLVRSVSWVPRSNRAL